MSLLRRKRAYHLVRSPRFFRWFRRNTDAVFSHGNRLEFYQDGGEFFAPFFQSLHQAEQTIFLEFYIIHDDATGGVFADLLLAAAARGVKVFLLYDYIGCFYTPGAYFRRLEKGGVRCRPFNPPPFRRGLGWFDRRDHRKMAIIDGRIAFVAGLNIGDEYGGNGKAAGRWRDVGLGLEGPAVCELFSLFRENWQPEKGAGGDELASFSCWDAEAGDAQVMIVNGGPHHSRSLIRNAFRMAIAGAAGNVKVMNPYFIPGPRIVRSLLRAAGRGVQVQLILPAVSDVALVRLVSRSYYAQLLKGGVEIYELQGKVLHAKVMLIDDCWAVIGSANLDQRSFHRNYEVNVIVDSPDFGTRVAAMFQQDLASSRRVVLAEHERRGWLVQFMERLCSPVSWFL